jgi:Calcineurin-like phosphoesterase
MLNAGGALMKRLIVGMCAVLLSVSCALHAHDREDDDNNTDNYSERGGSKVTFAIIGDLPYNALESEKLDRVIADINADKRVRFVMHNGDIKSGSSPCDDATFTARLAQINTLKKPVFYTPGDNEWTDCHRTGAGRFNPLERLTRLRQIFYAQPDFSLGSERASVFSQRRVPGYETYVENFLWMRAGVVFGMVHVVGSNNNLDPWSGIDATDTYATPRADRVAEFKAREAANLMWLDTIFETAKRVNAPAVLIGMQANPNFDLPATDQQRQGFNAFIDKLAKLTIAFGKPVVLTHGDSHTFRIDKPLLAATPGSTTATSLENFTRLESFGSPNVHWVRVTVDRKDPNVFRIEQRIVTENNFPREMIAP